MGLTKQAAVDVKACKVQQSCKASGKQCWATPSGNTVSDQGLSQVKRRAGGFPHYVIIPLSAVNMTIKILVAEQSYTHLVTKES